MASVAVEGGTRHKHCPPTLWWARSARRHTSSRISSAPRRRCTHGANNGRRKGTERASDGASETRKTNTRKEMSR
eukprot:5506130-Pleurochrysis_carterae.AAC.2